ncbi:cytochrome P450 [Streptomyces wedmorensis]
MSTLHTVPRMPGGLPFLGHALQFQRRPLAFVQALRERGDVVEFRVGPQRAFAVNRPDLINDILVAQAKRFEKGRMFDEAKVLVGEGIFTSEGDYHLSQRRLVQSVFHRNQLERYVPEIQRYAETTIGRWVESPRLPINRACFAHTLGAISSMLFGQAADERLLAGIQQEFPIILDGLLRRTAAPAQLMNTLPTPANRRFDKAVANMRRSIEHYIAGYDPVRAPGGLLSILTDEKNGLTGKQIYDEVATILLAGTESTADALSWACYMIASHDEVQSALQEEADQIMTSPQVSYGDLARLPVMQRVINEVLRLFPSTWVLTREPVEDVELGGYRIPARSMVIFSVRALHRDPLIYPDPDAFLPDRWLALEQGPSTERRQAFIPFGAGIRGCIGEQLARAELGVFLAVMCRNVTVRTIPGEPQPDVAATIMPVPTTINLSVKRRDN